MLGSPTHAVVAGPDSAALVAFLAAFGWAETGRHAGAVEVAAEGDGGRGRVLVDPAAVPAAGPIALDVYTTDLDATVAAAEAAGAAIAGRATIELGPLVMEQAMIVGPAGLRVVAIAANHRRPSVLDAGGGRHSELHSVVWGVDAIDDALPFWRDEAGLAVPFDVPIDHEGVAEVMGLVAGSRVRMAMTCGPDEAPVRFEFLEHLDRPRPGSGPATGQTAGAVAAIAFTVADLDAAVAGLPGAGFATIDRRPRPWARRSVAGVAPAGVRFALFEESEGSP